MKLIRERRATVLIQLSALGLIVGLILAVYFTSTEQTPTGIPEILGDQQLVTAVTGREAIEQVGRQLHGVSFDLRSAYVAEYSGPSGKSTVWLAEAESPQEAEDLFDRMTAKISDGNPVFTDLQRSTADGRVTYSLTGMGQKHFYFLESGKLVWIATTTADAEQLLKQALEIHW